jgi:hypothetical protein
MMFPGFSYEVSTWLHYGVYALFGVLCLGVIARALWAPLDVFRAASCGGCGYAVTSGGEAATGGVGAGARCPECGGLYTKVGISTVPMAVRLRGGLSLALIAWTALVVLAGEFAFGWLEQQAMMAYSIAMSTSAGTGSGSQNEHLTTEFTPVEIGSRFGFPDDDIDYRISLTLDLTTGTDKAQSGTCVLKLRRNGEKEWWALTIDVADGSYTVTDENDKQLAKGKRVDDAVLEAWFAGAGIDTKSRSVKRSMVDAAKLAKYAVNDPAAIETMSNGGSWTQDDRGALRGVGSSRSVGSSGSTVMGMPAGPMGPSVRALMVAFGVLGAVYLAGCVGIIWRNRRLVRPLTHPVGR